MARALTAMQTAFVSHYVETGNASEAARRAGYSPKGSDKVGARLVGNERVSAAIARARSRHEAATGISKQALLDKLWAIVQEPEASDRVSAAREISKILGYYAPKRAELSGPGGSPIPLATGKGSSDEAERKFDEVLGLPQPETERVH